MSMSTSSLYPPPPLYAFNEGITRGEMLPPMIPTITARAFGEVTPVPSGGPQQPELVNVREIDTKSIASSSSASASSSLLALNAELLLVYIDVFHTLCTSPSAYARKVENLQVLIWNIKHRYVDQIKQYQYATSLCHLCLCLLSLRRNLLFPADQAANIYIHIYIYVCMCVCVCVCTAGCVFCEKHRVMHRSRPSSKKPQRVEDKRRVQREELEQMRRKLCAK